MRGSNFGAAGAAAFLIFLSIPLFAESPAGETPPPAEAAEPTPAEPTSAEPTSAEPTSAEPTSAEPTSAEPTSAEPTSAEPTPAETAEFEQLRQKAEAGDADAQNELIVRYTFAWGTARDYTRAFRWAEKGAKGGNPFAMMALGGFYGAGMGVGEDHEASIYWTKKLAGQMNLSEYVSAENEPAPEGEPGDPKPISQIRQEAEQGELEPEILLAVCYAVGHAVAEDHDAAIYWIQRIAGQVRHLGEPEEAPGGDASAGSGADGPDSPESAPGGGR